jgi:hypothetical protein
MIKIEREIKIEDGSVALQLRSWPELEDRIVFLRWCVDRNINQWVALAQTNNIYEPAIIVKAGAPDGVLTFVKLRWL